MIKTLIKGKLKKRRKLGNVFTKINNYLYNIAMKSPLHKWALSLTGWKWWVWQLVVGGIVLAILEYLLNIIGLTLLPWR